MVAFLLIATVFVILNTADVLRISWLPKSSVVFVTILVPVLAALVPLLQWLFTMIERGRQAHSPDPGEADQAAPEKSASTLAGATSGLSPPRQDWGDAPDIKAFHGRQQELTSVEQWICREGCRIVAIVGMGGIGKTALAATSIRELGNQFDRIFWRSLQNALPLPFLINECLGIDSEELHLDLPGMVDRQISLLIDYMRRFRCLLILDNFDTVLQAGRGSGTYRDGYENYGHLLRRVGESRHQSCLIVTSREEPVEVGSLKGDDLPVRSLHLAGLSEEDSVAVLKEKGLSVTQPDWAEFVRLYSGNPLALKLVAQIIRDLFNSDVHQFLRTGTILSGNVYDLLDQQFERLPDLEQSVICWLAVNREARGVDGLLDDLAGQVTQRLLIEALASLRRRSMIEVAGEHGYTLQPVIMEYVTNRIAEQAIEDIQCTRLGTVQRYPLLKITAKDYIRESQRRMILAPIAAQLQRRIGMDASLGKLNDLLPRLRQLDVGSRGYGAGNVLNLLIQLKCDLRGYDFSRLVVRQADLREVPLHDVSFAGADLESSVFTDTFGGVLSLTFSPVGLELAAGTARGEIRIWDAADGTPIQTLRGHLNSIWSVAFNRNGRTLVSGGQDQLIRVWDLDHGRCERVLVGHTSRVRCVAISPDSSCIASCGAEDQSIRLWELASGQAVKTIHHDSRVWTVAFSPDGTLLASGGQESSVRLWSVTTGECVAVLPGNGSWVWAVTFSPDGRYLACGCEDSSVRLWDIEHRECHMSFTGHSERIRSVAFSPDSATLASGGHDETVRLWEVRTGRCLRILREPGDRVWAVAFSQDGSLVASGGEDQAVRLWETSRGDCIRTLQGHVERISCVRFSPVGDFLVSAGEGEEVRIWDPESGRCLRKFRGHAKWISCVDVDPSGTLIASGSHDQSIKLWDASSGSCIKTFYGHQGRIRGVVFAPDGALLASASEDRTVRLWKTSTGECTAILSGHVNWSRSISIDPSGKLLASGGEDQSIRFWELNTGNSVKVIDAGCRVYSVAFSPDGSLLASGGEDLTVKIWSVASGDCVYVLSGHTGGVRSVSFGPTGRVVASGGEDQDVRIWDIGEQKCVRVFHNECGWIRSVSFSPDGRLLAVGNEEDGLQLWDIHAERPPRTLVDELLYQGMIITGAKGLTAAQHEALIALGAVDERERSGS